MTFTINKQKIQKKSEKASLTDVELISFNL